MANSTKPNRLWGPGSSKHHTVSVAPTTAFQVFRHAPLQALGHRPSATPLTRKAHQRLCEIVRDLLIRPDTWAASSAKSETSRLAGAAHACHLNSASGLGGSQNPLQGHEKVEPHHTTLIIICFWRENTTAALPRLVHLCTPLSLEGLRRWQASGQEPCFT